MRFTTRPELTGSFGMVSSTHWLASAAGMSALERGGNAFDAAVTAGFVLQVVEPHLNGPAGEVVMVGQEHGGEPFVVCGQGNAPAGASVAHYRESGFVVVPGTGLWAACPPGSVHAWLELLARHGTMTVGQVLEPAVHYAATGYPVVPKMAGSIAAGKELFQEDWSTSGDVYLPGGEVPRPGRNFRNPDLAATFGRLIEVAEESSDRTTQIRNAQREFYQGGVAKTIAQFVAETAVPDGHGRPHIAPLTYDDIASHATRFEAPRTYDYGGLRVHKAGPWSQGPVFLQQLSLLAGFDIAGMDRRGDQFIHIVTEATKLAMADRDAWYGDPDGTADRVGDLLADSYVAGRRSLISEYASLELRPGRPAGADEPRILQAPEGMTAEVGAGEPTMADYQPESGDTCQVDVIDRHGNAIACTPSGGWLQGSPVVPGLGFGLSTRLQMNWLDDSHPSGLRPGQRPRTTLTPTLATRGGDVEMAFGTPGGDKQDQWTTTFFVTVVDHGRNFQEAIDEVMFQSEHLVKSFAPRRAEVGHMTIEGRADPSVVEALRRRGHLVTVESDWSLGRIAAVGRDPHTGFLRAGANPRGMQGYAVGR